MEISHQRAESTYLKLFLGIPLGLALLGFLCWAGYRSYANFESGRLARRGLAFLTGGDLRQAGLAARSGLQLAPDSLPNLRLLGQIAEASGDETALNWRRKAFEKNPASAADAIAFARCALQFGDPATADKVLSGLRQKARATADFHAAAAQLAEASKDLAAAEQEWNQAVKLAPADTSYQLEYATVLLRMDESAKRSSGIEILQKLRTDEKQRLPATRALIVDALARHRDPETVTQWAQELQNYPEARFSDRILYAEILRQVQPAQFAKYLSEMEHEVSTNPADVASLVSWMSSKDLSLLALDYARSLPDGMIKKWPIPAALAAACDKVADWKELHRHTEGTWNQYEFLRHSYLARALRGEGKPGEAGKEWAAAEKEASGSAEALNELRRLTAEWGWEKERVELLWDLTKHPAAQLGALRQLRVVCQRSGDTPGLQRVLARLVELQPDDDQVLNDLTQIRLLLHADLEQTQRAAADLYKKERSNPAFAATYAFALHSKGNTKDALAIMASLSEEQLRSPVVAAVYGIMLAAAGHHEAASGYLRIAASVKLLPEEERLLTAAENAGR